MKKPVFGVCNLMRLKLGSLEISALASRGIILSSQQTIKAQLSLHIRNNLAYGINRFSHDVAQIATLSWSLRRNLKRNGIYLK